MTREEAKHQIQSSATQYLQRDRSGKGFICPICGSGSGSKGTGITTKDGVHFTCWAGCFTNSDIIDIIGQQYGLDGYNEKLERACEIFKVSYEPRAPREGNSSPQYQKQDKIEHTHNSIHTTTYTQPQQPEEDYTSFFKAAHARIKETDYAQRRGLSDEVIERFMIGYEPAWKHPKAPGNAPLTPRLIIPTSRGSYLARDTREEIPEGQQQYSKSKVGKMHPFNIKALQTAQQPLFIVEGEIDALAVMSVGGEAVALGSAGQVKSFLRIVDSSKPTQPLLIALDNDEAGQKAADELGAGLQKMGLSSYRVNPYGDAKDAGEAILQDRERFRAAIEQAVNVEQEQLQAEKEAYLSRNAARYLQAFIDGITDSVNTPCVQTGFPALDKVLDGGLYEGLYIVGAISSLGKTTLITQIADQIAQAGNDVIIFSLEMARTEIMAKSISRHTLIKALQQKAEIKNAKTARGITDGKRYINYSRAEQQLIQEAISEYGSYAERIYIHEGIGNIGADQIRETVEKHILYTGKRPVCIVDYLQILAPYSDRATDKQSTDHNVMELKRVTRDCKVPLIAISSFNRANYKEAVTMEAFKESGAVEYSSDVLIGLQLEGAGSKDFNATEEKKKNPRSIELVILKNRNGSVGNKVAFQYYPLFNYFKEAE